MRIALLFLYTESWNPIADIVLKNAQQYCHRHGYELMAKCYKEPYPSDFGFNKLTVIQDIFNAGYYDVVWSLDLDTLITNHTINVERYVDDRHDFFICKDFNGINAGSFIIKKSEWSIKFLQKTLSYKERGYPFINCEQDAINRYIAVRNDYGVFNKIKILPHPSINSYMYELYHEIPLQTHEQGNWNPTDLLLHLPGVSMEKRLDILKTTPVIL